MFGQTYRAHEASREAIELAFDAILQEKMKVRAKFGFRPPRTGRKTDAAGDQLVRHSQQSSKSYFACACCMASLARQGNKKTAP